jgi:hypothetical protein
MVSDAPFGFVYSIFTLTYTQSTLLSSYSIFSSPELFKDLEHLQEFAKIYLANPVFCQLLKSYAK